MQKLLLMLVFIVSFVVASDDEILREVKFTRSARIFIDQDHNENVILEHCYYGDIHIILHCLHNRALNQYSTYDDNDWLDISAESYESKKNVAQIFLQRRN